MRVPLGEGGQPRDDIAYAEARRHAHSEQPAQLAALANAMLGLIQRREDGSIRARKSLPASVGTTARVVRDKSPTPSSASSLTRSATTLECRSWQVSPSERARCKIRRGSYDDAEKFEGPMTAISARLAARRLHYAWIIVALTFVVIVVTAGVRQPRAC